MSIKIIFLILAIILAIISLLSILFIQNVIKSNSNLLSIIILIKPKPKDDESPSSLEKRLNDLKILNTLIYTVILIASLVTSLKLFKLVSVDNLSKS